MTPKHRALKPTDDESRRTLDKAVNEFNEKFSMWKQELRISVYRVHDGNRLKFLGCYPASDVDEEFVRELYGAGKYTLKLIDGGGRWLSQATISIGQRHL